MAARGRDIIVVGASAGGLEALEALVGELPPGLAASIFVVQHLSPESNAGALLRRLGRYETFGAALAVDGDEFERGRIYIAPPDSHLLVKKNHLLVTKGARENRYRPGIDPLFRSAAAAYGPRVIAVLLSGMLDDGTAGLLAVTKCGGVAVVQDPRDAMYPDMPQSALNNANVDHCVPITQMGALLERLVHEKPGKATTVPDDVRTEALIAERVLSDVAQVSGLGRQVPYNCPNCGGVLWELKARGTQRFRCHTGHSFTASALLTSQNEKVEETLWVSLRMFEERKNLLNNMARGASSPGLKRSYADKAKTTDVHIERIRAMLLVDQPAAKRHR